MRAIDLAQLRRYALARSLFEPTTLGRAIQKLGFVQADPIRAPAAAQDLTLRHRVRDYRAGELERRYAALALEEDFFINYGYLPRAHAAWMHPRTLRKAWNAATTKRAAAVLSFVHEHGAVHPRDVDARFGFGTVRNAWGGSSNATTQLLDDMHYRGLLRVQRRHSGTRVYAPQAPRTAPRDLVERQAALDALIDLAVNKYAPLPAPSLGPLLNRLRWGAPQFHPELKAAIARARQRFAHAQVEGVDWYWPAGQRPGSAHDTGSEQVRLLSPFDPVVWDRRRFELFWGWAYRFEAYTPVAKRKLGYYALPLLWRERVLGWGNVTLEAGQLDCKLGFVGGRPRDPAFRRELEAELERLRRFLTAR